MHGFENFLHSNKLITQFHFPVNFLEGPYILFSSDRGILLVCLSVLVREILLKELKGEVNKSVSVYSEDKKWFSEGDTSISLESPFKMPMLGLCAERLTQCLGRPYI